MDNDDALSRRSFLRAGTVGAATAATAGTAAAQEGTETATPTGTSNGTATGTSTGNGTATGTSTGGGGGGGETHTVDMTDDLVFDPDEITIAPGDTIVWENVGTVGHSVTAYEDEIPEEAEYFASGGFDAEQPARDAYPEQGDIPGGESYEHTFEVEGEYGYFCIPHEQVGMVGTVIVSADAGGDGGGGGAAGPAVPDSAKTLGVGAAFAMVATLLIAFFFLKYGGDNPGHETEG
ncbi:MULTISPECIES: plastocyanin/azurin family copper-binding protein [Halolamina]|uniref:Plastocyanin n=1 Tax=Halolamina pelagica TaxID=699431 RepID=A0A1I5R9J9_9EURY|nr:MULTISPECIES: plastocyanin/azurin family copper-binding protein [Halolamina]NHX35756.1 plastocyanin [Halolamina sp. R1-12]SFP55224.1 Plastocyanin [Halolamina pelagica]